MASPPDSWPTRVAQIAGRVTRGGVPLIGLPLDLRCGYLTPDFSQRTFTDSTGRYLFNLNLVFPQEQSLADGDEARCEIRQAQVTLDPPRQTNVLFAQAGSAPRTTQVNWDLPDPVFEPGRAVGHWWSIEPNPVLIRLGQFTALRVGVVPFPAFMALELIAPPTEPQLPQYRTIPGPTEWFPLAIRVSGRIRPTTGSTVYLLMPDRIASTLSSRAIAVGFVRMENVTAGSREQYYATGTQYDSRLHMLQVDVLPPAFHLESNGDIAATILIGFFRQPR